jgi:IclR family pca regulon transcriptional regulator
MSSTVEDSQEFVQSFARGLSLIEAFGQARSPLTLSEVAAGAGISRAAARRLLHTLVALGYAGFDGKRFDLRPRVLSLGFAYLSSAGIWEVARPYLEDLARSTGESCSASVLDATEIVHVARFPAPHRIMSITVKVGDRLPAHASAMGRVLLASQGDEGQSRFFRNATLTALTPRTVTDPKQLRNILVEVRKQGYAEVMGELQAGLRSIAVPVIGKSGETIAAISVSMLSDSGKSTKALLRQMRDCAEKIHAALAVLPENCLDPQASMPAGKTKNRRIE